VWLIYLDCNYWLGRPRSTNLGAAQFGLLTLYAALALQTHALLCFPRFRYPSGPHTSLEVRHNHVEVPPSHGLTAIRSAPVGYRLAPSGGWGNRGHVGAFCWGCMCSAQELMMV
jgi:hypothetical protein